MPNNNKKAPDGWVGDEEYPIVPDPNVSAMYGLMPGQSQSNNDTEYRRRVREQAVGIAERLVHASVNGSPAKKCDPTTLANDLVEAASIIENALLHKTVADKTGQAVANAGAAQQAARFAPL